MLCLLSPDESYVDYIDNGPLVPKKTITGVVTADAIIGPNRVVPQDLTNYSLEVSWKSKQEYESHEHSIQWYYHCRDHCYHNNTRYRITKLFNYSLNY